MLIKFYGLKEIKNVNEKTIVRYAKKFDIPTTDLFELDSSYYSFLFSKQTDENKAHIKNHYQPLQALYFNKAGQLQSFQINCYAGGFPNLKWERNDIMTSFPPKNQAPIDSLISLEQYLQLLRPLSQTPELKIDGYDFIVIVFWSRYMGRQSKRLIRIVQDNRALAADKKVRILYANTDNVDRNNR